MEKTGKTIVFILGFVLFLNILILNAGFASANTLVGGTIYNSDYSEVIGFAHISVQCGSDTHTTDSLNDGTYAIVFDTESCDASYNVKVISSKDNLYGEETSLINNSTEEGKESIAIANINMKTKATTGPTTSGGKSSGGGGFYMCGNGKCDSGETASTCAEDCAVKLTYSDEDNENSGLIELGVSESEKDQNAITGAVIGESGKGKSYLVILIVVIALIVILLSARLIRLNRKK